MKGLWIIVVIIAFLIAGVAVIVYNSQITCENDADCLEKHFQKCKQYGINDLRTSEMVVDFEGAVIINFQILGEKDGDRCKTYFGVRSVEDSEDLWAEGKNMTCTSTEEEINYKNALDFLEDNCEGEFATLALERCYVSGSSTSAGRTRENARCKIAPIEPDIIVNTTIDSADVCRRGNNGDEDIRWCLDALEKIYLAFANDDTSYCAELTRYESDKTMCEEALDNYATYVGYYGALVEGYEEAGII
ncbi:MAG: hypothetical protein KKB31_03965 [Nanoarchaeota archaeon]|nr:hypothetical protein [Nanoarchaeota archaeon]